MTTITSITQAQAKVLFAVLSNEQTAVLQQYRVAIATQNEKEMQRLEKDAYEVLSDVQDVYYRLLQRRLRK